MISKQAVEASLVEALLTAIGAIATIEEHSDRPDIVLSQDGHWIGVEVTELHPDESNSGSAVRAAEERAARNNSCAPSFHWCSAEYSEAIGRRLAEKVRLAADYHCGDGGALWLLVACQIPIIGRAAATRVQSHWLSPDILNAFEPLLVGSRFERAFIHLVSDGEVFCWDCQSGWRLVENQRSSERQRDTEAQTKAVWDLVNELRLRPFPVGVIVSWG
jgi:hypothetical protein